MRELEKWYAGVGSLDWLRPQFNLLARTTDSLWDVKVNPDGSKTLSEASDADASGTYVCASRQWRFHDVLLPSNLPGNFIDELMKARLNLKGPEGVNPENPDRNYFECNRVMHPAQICDLCKAAKAQWFENVDMSKMFVYEEILLENIVADAARRRVQEATAARQ